MYTLHFNSSKHNKKINSRLGDCLEIMVRDWMNQTCLLSYNACFSNVLTNISVFKEILHCELLLENHFYGFTINDYYEMRSFSSLTLAFLFLPFRRWNPQISRKLKDKKNRYNCICLVFWWTIYIIGFEQLNWNASKHKSAIESKQLILKKVQKPYEMHPSERKKGLKLTDEWKEICFFYHKACHDVHRLYWWTRCDMHNHWKENKTKQSSSGAWNQQQQWG